MALFALMGADGVDEGEFHCDEAVKHLSDCCGAESVVAISCDAGRGCDMHRPNLDDPLATQVRDLSCDEIAARGYCDKAPQSAMGGGQ